MTSYSPFWLLWKLNSGARGCKQPPRQAHDVNTTSPQRRCNVMTLHRRWGDVIFTSCARWVATTLLYMKRLNKTESSIFVLFSVLCFWGNLLDFDSMEIDVAGDFIHLFHKKYNYCCFPAQFMGLAERNRLSVQMRTEKAQISLSIRAVWSGPSLSANRIIGHYRMYKWRANTQMRLCACAEWIWLCILRMFEATVRIAGLK